MLKLAVIRASTKPRASRVVLKQKMDGRYIFCVEYRRLNPITVMDSSSTSKNGQVYRQAPRLKEHVKTQL